MGKEKKNKLSKEELEEAVMFQGIGKALEDIVENEEKLSVEDKNVKK